MVIVVVLAYAFIIYFDLVPLYRKKHWRDFWVNMTFSIFTFVIAILISLGVAIPSPAYPIKNFITSIVGK